MKHLFFMTLFALILTSLAPLASAGERDHIVIGLIEDVDNLNPILGTSAAAKYVHQLFSSPLTYLNDNWQLVCGLCTKIPTMENGLARIIEKKKHKYLRADWEIKKDINWNDGKPVTGYDVFKTWIIASHPKTHPNSIAFANIRKIIVNKSNPRKFTIEYQKIRYNFGRLDFHILPAHIEGPIFDAEPENYRTNTTYNVAPGKKGLFNGIFAITKKALPHNLEFQRITPSPTKLNNIEIAFYNSSRELMTALQLNKIQMISSVGTTPDDLIVFKSILSSSVELSKNYAIKLTSSDIFEHVDLNLRNPKLANVNVRRALAHAINREDLIANALNIPAVPATSFFQQNDPYFKTEKDLTRFDLDDAKKLLESSGWKLTKNGMRKKAGKLLTLSLITTEGDDFRARVANYLVKQWRQIGVNAEVKLQAKEEFFHETLKKAHFRGFIMYAWLTVPHIVPRSMFYSKEIPNVQNSYTGQNSMSWVNKTVDEILENIVSEFDSKKRLDMMQTLQTEYLSDVPSIPLYWHPKGSVIPKNLQNYKISNLEGQTTLNVENWSF